MFFGLSNISFAKHTRYNEEAVSQRALLRREVNGRKRRKDTRYTEVEADVSLSSAELYLDILQAQVLLLFLFFVFMILQKKKVSVLFPDASEVVRLVFLRWVGRGGLFVQEGSLTRLATLECTLWVLLASARLLARCLPPCVLLEHARTNHIPFVDALGWAERHLGSQKPVVIDNGTLLGLLVISPSNSKKRSLLVEQTARQLYTLAGVSPCSLCRGAQHVLRLCDLSPPAPPRAALLFGASAVLSTLPGWTSALVIAARQLWNKKITEPVLAAAVGVWVLRAAFQAKKDSNTAFNDEDFLVRLSAFAAAGIANVRALPPVRSRVARSGADALLGFSQIVERILDDERNDLQQPGARSAPPMLVPELSRLPSRPAEICSLLSMPPPCDSVFAVAMSVICGCETEIIWPALRKLEKAMAKHFVS